MDYRKQILQSIVNIRFALKDYENGVLAAVHDAKVAKAKDLSIYTKAYQDEYNHRAQSNLKAEVNIQRDLCKRSVSEEVQTIRDAYAKACTEQPSGSALAGF